MASQKNPSQPRTQSHLLILRKRGLAFWASALFILFLALSFKIPNTIISRYHTLQSLKSILISHPLKPTIINRLLGSFSSDQHDGKTPKSANSKPHYCVLWMAPFLSGGGYCSEAWSYITALARNSGNPRFSLAIEQHGDLENSDFWDGLPEKEKNLAYKLHSTKCRMNETVVICHSEPGAWYPPLFQTLPCPPTGYEEPLFVIGRTMFETDRLNPEHVRRCNRMRSVWVPTDFHVSTFVQSGVEPSKVVKMVQPVDVAFFNPSRYQPLNLPFHGKLILGSDGRNLKGKSERKEFVFLSIFKWEYRKGWDVLLRSYLEEFDDSDAVSLYLLTNPYHSESNFGNQIVKFVEDFGLEKPVNGWARVYVIDTHIPQFDLPGVYRAADAFVLPSRGEGWGRPLVEAMAMSVPVIATNWSGPTEFLTEENGYPLAVDQMSEVTEGPFKGHIWAEPSVNRLRGLMRHVVSNTGEARRKGMQAREDMVRRFSPDVVADLVTQQILKITENMEIFE